MRRKGCFPAVEPFVGRIAFRGDPVLDTLTDAEAEIIVRVALGEACLSETFHANELSFISVRLFRVVHASMYARRGLPRNQIRDFLAERVPHDIPPL